VKASKLFFHTSKDLPADVKLASHSLMIRSCLVNQLGSGLYNWLPIGWIVVQKISNIIRKNLHSCGLQEVCLSGVQPSDLWKETKRWHKYGRELLKLTDRHDNEFCLAPTHEEVVTYVAKSYIRSRKHLPFGFYQIQNKFRDEIRPRFGVMRAREFLMKDGYSFHENTESSQEFYENVKDAYHNIFSSLELDFRCVKADSGSIGGDLSHEFHVLADSGEDEIGFSNKSTYAANIEAIECFANDSVEREPALGVEESFLENKKTIEEICLTLGVEKTKCIKMLIVRGNNYSESNNDLIGIALRADHELNVAKIEKHKRVLSPFKMASDKDMKEKGMVVNFIGPKGLDIEIYADYSAFETDNFYCGANSIGKYFKNTNWETDCKVSGTFDFRLIKSGDKSPCGEGEIEFKRGIEVGHIFQLGNEYTKSLGFKVADSEGKDLYPQMGCYGIGVSRLVAASIEQNHDKKGILWPKAIAPFSIAIAVLNGKKSEIAREYSSNLYKKLLEKGVEVLLDDRDLRVGEMLSDLELIGIPYVVVVGERGLKEGEVEFKCRDSEVVVKVETDKIFDFIFENMSN
jgi:prolyl-tRNA synthetase